MTRTQISRPLGLRFSLLLMLASLPLAQQELHESWPLPLEVSAPTAPALQAVGRQQTLVYELLVSNLGSQPFTLKELLVSDEKDRPLAVIRGERWGSIAASLPGSPPLGEAPSGLALAPGSRALLYLWAELEEGRAAPTMVQHEFLASARNRQGEWNHSGPALPLAPAPMVIAPPVRGGTWWVSNGLGNDTNHRRFYVASGSLMIPQRFGADFHRLDPEGNNAVNKGRSLEDFHAYGEPLYAVADGEVLVVHDGLPDWPAGKAPQGLKWRDMPGNHVILKLGPRAHAMYVHMQAGRMQVKAGQLVEEGDLLGYIGNSGNSSAPHLHFHLADRPSVNQSRGIPFHFRSYDWVMSNYAFRSDQRPLPQHASRRKASVPGLGSVVRFPD